VQSPADRAQKLGRASEALLGHRAEDPRRRLLLAIVDHGVDALGRVGDEHVLPRMQPALGERLDEQLARAPDERGRRQHERLAGARVPHDRRARTPERFGVGVPVPVDRVGDADQHGVGRVDRVDLAAEDEVLVRQAHARVAAELRAPAANVVQTPGGSVDPHDSQAGAAQGHGARQTGVAETHNRDERLRACGLARDPRAARGGLPRSLAAASVRGLLDPVLDRYLKQMRCHRQFPLLAWPSPLLAWPSRRVCTLRARPSEMFDA
jgi:hypothetical protein